MLFDFDQCEEGEGFKALLTLIEVEHLKTIEVEFI